MYLRNLLIAAAATAAFAAVAHAQTATETLADNMRKSIALCGSQTHSDMPSAQVYINDQCARVHFQALQTYIDAVNQCLSRPYISGTIPVLSAECTNAKSLEAGLIKTFRPPAKKK